MSSHTLSVLVSNKPGVLARIAGLFSRRGFNIESLTVGPTSDPEVSRMTVVAGVDNPDIVEQIVKQLNKLVEVYKIIELEPNAVNRAMILIKVKCSDSTRPTIISTINLFRAHTVDVAPESITIEATGSTDKLTALINLLQPYGIIELATSGQVALSRGIASINDKFRPALARR